MQRVTGPSKRLSASATRLRKNVAAGDEPLETLCRFDRPGNGTQDLLNLKRALSSLSTLPVNDSLDIMTVDVSLFVANDHLPSVVSCDHFDST